MGFYLLSEFQSTIKNVEVCLDKGNNILDVKATPTQSSCMPKLDANYELTPEESSHYQSHEGILRLITDL